jgi:hypothetical protein
VNISIISSKKGWLEELVVSHPKRMAYRIGCFPQVLLQDEDLLHVSLFKGKILYFFFFTSKDF